MLQLADRMLKALADVTVGSVIVLVHVALADRERSRAARAPALAPTGAWRVDWPGRDNKPASHLREL